MTFGFIRKNAVVKAARAIRTNALGNCWEFANLNHMSDICQINMTIANDDDAYLPPQQIPKYIIKQRPNKKLCK